jgi:methylmalonyl-CoA/ethylmalonyl-CoA epimerase
VGDIQDLGQVAIPVTDMERAVAFYRDVVQLPFLFQAGPNLAFFDCGGVRVMLDIPEDQRFKHPASVLYYRVPDLQAAFHGIVTRGAGVHAGPHRIAKMPDHELWMAFLNDTEGNVFALMSEVRV